MIKRVLLVVAMVGTMMSSTVWGQFYRETYFDHMGDMSIISNNELNLGNDMMSAVGFYKKGGVFDAQDELLGIRDSIFHAMQYNRGFNHEQFDNAIKSVGNFMHKHPEDRRSGYLVLGYLYRHALPLSLRDVNVSLQYYHNVMGMTEPENHIDRAQLYYIMADCFDPKMSEAQMSEMSRYLGMATQEMPYYANGLGDIYLYGWGCYQDLYLSATLYDIAQRYGNEGSQFYAAVIRYIADHPAQTAEDSLALLDFGRYMYYLRIAQDYGRARQYAMLSVQNGFAPACYALATMHECNIPNLTMGQRRRDAFYWMRRGVDMGYAPCLEGMARICTQYGVDTAKGAIHHDLPNDQFSRKIQAECAKQAYEMRQRAIAAGSLPAMRRLAMQYAKGNEFGYPRQDKKQAYIMLTALTFYGDMFAEESLREMMKDYKVPEKEKVEVEEAIMRMVLDMNSRENNYMTKLYEKGEDFMPHFVGQWSNREYNKEWGLSQYPLYWSHLIRTHDMAIKYYRELQQQVKKAPGRYRAVMDAYCGQRIEQLEARMKRF